MTKHPFPLLLLPLLFATALPAASLAEDPAAAQEDATIAVVMEDCEASRPGKITSGTSILRLLFAGRPKEELAKRGVVQVDGQKYSLYLPKAKSYSTKNSKPSDADFENTSTLVSVDQNGDGLLTGEEGWFANLPLRLGDKMFDVTGIAADGSRIELKSSQAPLRGVIVGHSCPPFSFKTADGKQVNRESLAGKPFLLDIWSIT